MVAARNEPPLLIVTAEVTLSEDSVATIDGVWMSDADGDSAVNSSVTLTIAVGTISVWGGCNATVTLGSLTSSTALALNGSMAWLAACFASFSYTPPSNYNGFDANT